MEDLFEALEGGLDNILSYDMVTGVAALLIISLVVSGFLLVNRLIGAASGAGSPDYESYNEGDEDDF